MSDTEILSQILDLGDEWHIQFIEVDPPSNRVDITIGFGPTRKKSFFGRSKANSDIQTLSLRHLPILGMRTFLHVPAPGTGTVDNNKIWNPAGSKFTNEMEAFLIELLNNSTSNQAVAKISGITSAEVREVSERTGAGADNIADALSNVASSASTPAISSDYTETKSFELIEHSDIPSETHDNWQKVIRGEIPIQTNAVGLQMLLQRIRQDIANNPSEISRINSAKLLRQYFVKNQKQHKADLASIFGDTEQAMSQTGATTQTATNVSGIPADNHAIWQKIINGEVTIQTSNVALQMMMERVRQSVEKNPSESSRQAGTKILRQFFIKHKDRLANEAQQLGFRLAEPVTTNVEPANVSIPAEDATCWQDLIKGNLKIQTNAVGLQMMMERVRQSIEKNDSDTNRMAGIKILRQYFIKHQASAQNEILQLNGIRGTIPTKVTSSGPAAIPSESHPSWQRLINGDLVLDTDTVALKMMLQSVRISIEKNPSEASRQAGAKILRQYFIKHHSKHTTELNQLIAA
ncbi:MAG: hypothetical protein HND53_09845 [Proteobacteria bacterium]|nr:hypothetical protein [Pseudomonadota bacterium]NOG60790.1 hypothetical protein [Pseudomonadota bacterium]